MAMRRQKSDGTWETISSGSGNKIYHQTAEPIGAVTGDLWATDDALPNFSQEAVDNVYDNTKTYAVGDTCVHGGYWWVCNTAITAAEEWTEAHWTKRNIKTALDTWTLGSTTVGSKIGTNYTVWYKIGRLVIVSLCFYVNTQMSQGETIVEGLPAGAFDVAGMVARDTNCDAERIFYRRSGSKIVADGIMYTGWTSGTIVYPAAN